ncbi:MAG TPA: CHASE domain-containing protein [Noviherbaspirillum sp.]|uniref:CHASE domain-containing protein n=1 Tax=Noviherbaspirillum sp. TaxID=1926288 RepID=UPI002D4D060F|nr:CHASE domain-containing protein [Noviherbaspirillum sp.]HYD96610.1 CHASE domain-containing protein [Noviherbaspirillum sp.]
MSAQEERSRRVPDLLRARDLLTAAVFLASLLVTYQLWMDAARSAAQAVQSVFDYRVRDMNERIRQRLMIYEQVLLATKGLFAASENVDRAAFRGFVDTLNLSGNYPGIQGIGYAVVIRPHELARHVAAVRDEGFSDYLVRPEGRRDLYTAIVFLEPFYGRNLRAFGYDMYSEPIRRMAMDRARDTGEATLTGKVTLVQEGGNGAQAGFLMYLPVYRNDATQEAQERRRDRIAGWVYAPFRMVDFMRGLSEQLDDNIDVEIYDGASLSDEARMFDSNRNLRALATQHRLRHLSRMEIAHHSWTIAIAALPVFEQRADAGRAQLILQAGISISLLLALLMWIFLDDRARALHAANQAMQLALYDTLTGLPNRKLLDERLRQALAIARRNGSNTALLFIDLDKFKPVNDNYGHAYGDLLLKEVAQRLQGCMRESDTASRLGGDEFVALLPNVEGEHDVMVVAQKILDTLNQPFVIAGHTFDISASIGAAISPRDGRDGKALMRSADLAMYEAKNRGRSNVQFARQEGGAE